MKAISFLGPSEYKVTTYVYGEKEKTTSFFAEALPTFFPELERILVFVTPKVEQHSNLQVLRDRLGSLVEPVPIPDGHSERDLWAIFDALTNAVNEGEDVLFDITNSYRSLPFLVFLAAAYLRTARAVNVVGVIYGAFEAGGENKRSPVFDLTPFVSLLDWLTATDQFVQTGDARRLANLLNPNNELKGAAADASNALSSVSLAAFLCQPFRLMPEAALLDQRLRDAEQAFPFIPRPYQTLRTRVVDTFGAFGAEPSDDPAAILRAQIRLIEWYHRNNQLIQTVTLAREWLISAATHRLGLTIDLTSSRRQVMDRAVSGLAMVGRTMRDEETGEKYEFSASELNEYGRIMYDTWPEYGQVVQLWNDLSPIRNALDHAEHQLNGMKLEKLVKKVNEKVMPELRSLADRWNLRSTIS